jgi:hypothetical protein
MAVIAVLATALSAYATAQLVSVQFISGRSGRVVKKGVRVWVHFDNGKGREILDLRTDSQGVIQFDAGGATTFQVSAVGFVPCGEQPIGVPARNYSVEDVLKHGLLTKNECGTLHSEPLRGRLSYFVRPATWWELFKN